jgi:hypothetical protein
MINYLTETTEGKERFNLAYSFRGCSPSWWGGHGGTVHIMVDRKQDRAGKGQGKQ